MLNAVSDAINNCENLIDSYKSQIKYFEDGRNPTSIESPAYIRACAYFEIESLRKEFLIKYYAQEKTNLHLHRRIDILEVAILGLAKKNEKP